MDCVETSWSMSISMDGPSFAAWRRQNTKTPGARISLVLLLGSPCAEAWLWKGNVW